MPNRAPLLSKGSLAGLPPMEAMSLRPRRRSPWIRRRTGIAWRPVRLWPLCGKHCPIGHVSKKIPGHLSVKFMSSPPSRRPFRI